MKRILLFLCAIVALNVANATTILFAVDMTGKTVHANGMHIAGSFKALHGAHRPQLVLISPLLRFIIIL